MSESVVAQVEEALARWDEGNTTHSDASAELLRALVVEVKERTEQRDKLHELANRVGDTCSEMTFKRRHAENRAESAESREHQLRAALEDDSLLDAIRPVHRHEYPERCAGCGQPWECDAVVLVGVIDRARAALTQEENE